MDLSEVRSGVTSRHPWEIARADAIVRILRERGLPFPAVLDYGCGDGFTGERVQRAFGSRELVGVDVHLPPEACGKRQVPEGTLELVRDEATLDGRRFDLLLLCDVIEHVEDDREFVRSIVSRRLRPGALTLVTVPAFQALFSDHDRALRHFRRYSLAELRRALSDSGLEVLDGGYLFASLIAARAASKLAEAAGRRSDAHGVGGWSGGPGLTQWLVRALGLDNTLLLSARRFGVTVPGLTAWALCRTR